MNTSTLTRPHLPTPHLTTPHFTTLWGGSGLVVAGVLSLLAIFNVAVPLARDYYFPFSSTIPQLLASIILLVSVGILALGIRGESGIAGRSVVGKTALLVFGLGHLVFYLVGLLSKNLSQNALTIESYFDLAFEIIVLVAGVIAAVVVLRAGVLHGFARWVLVPVAVWNAIIFGVMSTPLIQVAYVLVVWQADIVPPVLLIVLGLSYLLQGQSAAIRHRLHIINENW
jgi:hypothetical protein